MILKTASGLAAARSLRPGESVASAKAADGAINMASDVASSNSFTRERRGAVLVLEVRPQSSCTVNLSFRADARAAVPSCKANRRRRFLAWESPDWGRDPPRFDERALVKEAEAKSGRNRVGTCPCVQALAGLA